MRELNFDPQYLTFLSLGDGAHARQLAQLITEITLNWGRLEYALYLVLEAIDSKRVGDWTCELFTPINWTDKQAVVHKQVLEATRGEPKLCATMKQVLAELDDLCKQQNALVHGLWKKNSDRTYEVYPLHFHEGKNAPGDAVTVHETHLLGVLKRMARIRRQLANLGAEMSAHQSLQTKEREK